MDQLERLVTKANHGDKRALELVILNIKDLVYNLSLKMLLFPEDAKDATQEILIRVITHLSTFKHKSKFTTWVYRIAVNYLISYKGKLSSNFAMSFEEYGRMIDTGQSEQVAYTVNEGELNLLEEEVKVSCTQGVLLCLNELDRMIYILSELFGYNSVEGAALLNISSDNYRKKLSRARHKIRNFLQSKCDLVNESASCRCRKKIDFLIDLQLLNPKKLRFAHLSKRSIDVVRKLQHLERTAAVYQSVPNFDAPQDLINRLKETLEVD